jgi:Golgi nucleoside diphosphatase
MYFLVPFNKNVNFYIGDPKVETHLFTQTEETDNMSESPKLEYNLEDMQSEMSDIDMEDFMKNLSNFIGVDLTQIEVDEEQVEIVREKTLDEILDKISECGIES